MIDLLEPAHDVDELASGAPRVVPARATDRDALATLLAATFPDCSPHTVWDLPWSWPRYRVVRAGEHARPVACGMLAPVDAERAELRGIAVDPGHRGRGLARLVVEDLLTAADRDGRPVVCVTRRPAFFDRFDFRPTSPAWLPVHRRSAPGSAPARPDAAPRIAMLRTPRPAFVAA